MFYGNSELNNFTKEFDTQAKFYSTIECIVSKTIVEEQTKFGYSCDDRRC